MPFLFVHEQCSALVSFTSCFVITGGNIGFSFSACLSLVSTTAIFNRVSATSYCQPETWPNTEKQNKSEKPVAYFFLPSVLGFPGLECVKFQTVFWEKTEPKINSCSISGWQKLIGVTACWFCVVCCREVPVDIPDKYGFTPLMVAAQKGYIEWVLLPPRSGAQGHSRGHENEVKVTATVMAREVRRGSRILVRGGPAEFWPEGGPEPKICSK